MSGFFGIFRPQGGPVDLEAFEQMKTAIHREGFDGMETHVEEKIAMGHLMLRVSPESKYDKQPLKSSCGNYILVGHFRLDYRDELGDKLGLTQSELEVTPDSQLAMLAYQKWKDGFVKYLEGDWACVVFDKLKNNLYLAKDKTGISALFYISVNNNLIFSSDSQTILGIRSIFFQIDEGNLKKMLSLGFVLNQETTLVKNLHFVRNAAIINFNNQLISNAFTYWVIPLSENINYQFFLDYLLDFNFFYSNAVKSTARIEPNPNSSLGVFLSSGLDSSSVFYFAAKELECQNKNIHTFTSYPSQKIDDSKMTNVIYDEMPIVSEFVKGFKNVEPNYYNFPQYDIFLEFKSVPFKDAFNPIVSKNTFWIDGIMEEARKKGIKHVLTGQVGNCTVTWSGGYHYISLFFKFNLGKLINDLRWNRSSDSYSLFKIIKHKFVIPFLIYFSSVYKSNLFGNDPKLKLIINDHYLSDRSFFFNMSIFKTFLPKLRSREDIQRDVIQFCGISWALSSFRKGIQISDPTSNSRLIEFLNSVPQRMFFLHFSRKFFFKQLMKRRIPNMILDNNLRKIQSLDFALRMKKDSNFKGLESMGRSGSKEGGFLDLCKLEKILDEINADPMNFLEAPEVNIFLRGYSLNIFLNSMKKS